MGNINKFGMGVEKIDVVWYYFDNIIFGGELVKIAVCDDDRVVLSTIGRIAEEHGGVQVRLFSSGEALLEACSRESFDLYFIDIMLGSDNGIAVAGAVCACHSQARIVFITAHVLDYAEKIFHGVRPYGYIGKPLDSARVTACIRRALDEDAREGRTLTVSRRGVDYDLLQSSIFYIESRGRLAHIHRGDNVITVYERLDDLEKKLDDRFVRCHQSYLVNLDRVTAMGAESFELGCVEDDKQVVLRISRNHLKESRLRYFEHKGRTTF